MLKQEKKLGNFPTKKRNKQAKIHESLNNMQSND